MEPTPHRNRLPLALAIMVTIMGSAIAHLYWRGYRHLQEEQRKNEELRQELLAAVASTSRALTERMDTLAQRQHTQLNELANSLGTSISEIEHNLNQTKSELQHQTERVAQELVGEKERIASLQDTAQKLEKLNSIDEELLKKYSKVFFLNENYVPRRLAEIKNEYLYSERETQYFLADALPFLTQMLDDAKRDGVTIYVKSAYRSFNEQQKTKSAYTVVYGEGTANQFSADQGYSEHQLGTTVDLITTGIGGQLDGFYGTDAYYWLVNNAYKYGFIMSYPENNEFYTFEPWHWRFVGRALARDIHDTGISFYDRSQRSLDEYLINIFD